MDDLIRDENLDNSPDQCQPCNNFVFESDMFGMRSEHQCPLCEGWRSFCHSCYKDHHLGGWNSCNHDYTGKTINACPRNHPKCVDINN